MSRQVGHPIGCVCHECVESAPPRPARGAALPEPVSLLEIRKAVMFGYLEAVNDAEGFDHPPKESAQQAADIYIGANAARLGATEVP